MTKDDGAVAPFDRMMGKPRACRHCGFAWSVHRSGNQLCPGTYPDGTLWRGQWDGNAPGTGYEPNHEGA